MPIQTKPISPMLEAELDAGRLVYRLKAMMHHCWPQPCRVHWRLVEEWRPNADAVAK